MPASPRSSQDAASSSTSAAGNGQSRCEPTIGDTVHVVGHGPAILMKLNESGGYEVKYPTGDHDVVDRDHILVHETMRSQSSTRRAMSPGCASPTGPRRLEYLGRAFDDESRTIRMPSATFGLVATMVGGGVLSLPYAMSQCGLVLGILILFSSAALSTWTLDMLVSCARCTGLDTFELVGHAAFGEGCRKLTVALVFGLTWLAQVAYFVLLQDLLSPTARLALPGLFGGMSQEVSRRTVVAIAAVVLAPMCYKGSLSALRFLCFASVGSVLLVGLILGAKAIGSAGAEHEIEIMDPDKSTHSMRVTVNLALWPESFAKLLYVFPMFGVSFLCHFNALPTHQELQRPTRMRMQRVLMLSMLFTTLLYLFVGLSGYSWAGHCTCGNILLNFAEGDIAVTIGRGALGLVLMLNFPLILQPSRNTLFRLLVMFCGLRPAPPAEQEGSQDAVPASQLAQSLVLEEEEIVLELPPPSGASPTNNVASVESSASGVLDSAAAARASAAAAAATAMGAAAVLRTGEGQVSPAAAGSRRGSVASGQASSPGSASPRASSSTRCQVHAYMREDTRGTRARGVEAIDTFEPKDETVQQSAADPSLLQRHVLTTLILLSSLLMSLFMQSILVVWSVLGSTVAFMIAFILPAAFWHRLVGPRSSKAKSRAVIALLITSVIMAVACSVMTALHLDAPPCPVVSDGQHGHRVVF